MSHIEAIGFIKKWVVSLTIHAEDFKADMLTFKGIKEWCQSLHILKILTSRGGASWSSGLTRYCV